MKRKDIGSQDITYKELEKYGEAGTPYMELVLKILHTFWVGNNEERADDVRIGSVDFFFDEDGHLHLDFVSRFSFNDNQRKSIIKAFDEAMEIERKKPLEEFIEEDITDEETKPLCPECSAYISEYGMAALNDKLCPKCRE